MRESMLDRREWMRLFEEAGLVPMRRLTEAASFAAYPERGYDVFRNIIVMASKGVAATVDEGALIRRTRHLIDRPALLGPTQNFSRRHYSPLWKADAERGRRRRADEGRLSL